MISVTVILEVDPAKVEEFERIAAAQAAASRAEPGCVRFEVSRQIDKPNVFVLCELYQDREAVEIHYATEHVANWRKVTPPLILSRTAVRGEVLE